MGTERQVMQDYLDALVKRADFPAYFTDDVVATFEGTDQRADGRRSRRPADPVRPRGAFDARMELKNLLTGDGRAAIEADFAGTHTGEFVPASCHRPRVRSPTPSSTTCVATRSARCASTSPMSQLTGQLTS